MKHVAYLFSGLILCVILIVILFFRVLSLESRVRNLGEPNGGGLAAMQDSMKRVQAELASTKELAPGLGEYMTTIQLHAGKLWFAAKATNWDLAQYELDELKETMEAAKGLNAEKNGVKISNVLDSVLQTQVAQLAESIKRKSATHFQKSYDETLSACNGCHTESGHKFIYIVRPSAPPVTNQKWEPSAK
jgi:Sec-independent protein translocase protein TatA